MLTKIGFRKNTGWKNPPVLAYWYIYGRDEKTWIGYREQDGMWELRHNSGYEFGEEVTIELEMETTIQLYSILSAIGSEYRNEVI